MPSVRCIDNLNQVFAADLYYSEAAGAKLLPMSRPANRFEIPIPIPCFLLVSIKEETFARCKVEIFTLARHLAVDQEKRHDSECWLSRLAAPSH